MAKLVKFAASQNIAADLEQQQLDDIGYDAEREYKIDKASRSDWEASATKAMAWLLRSCARGTKV